MGDVSGVAKPFVSYLARRKKPGFITGASLTMPNGGYVA